jgi:hypothetical protein
MSLNFLYQARRRAASLRSTMTGRFNCVVRMREFFHCNDGKRGLSNLERDIKTGWRLNLLLPPTKQPLKRIDLINLDYT